MLNVDKKYKHDMSMDKFCDSEYTMYFSLLISIKN
jgi:hypothetical protein